MEEKVWNPYGHDTLEYLVVSITNRNFHEYPELTLEQFAANRLAILAAVYRMKECYDRQPEDYEVRKYFEPCWTKFQEAKTIEQDLDALNNLLEYIHWK